MTLSLTPPTSAVDLALSWLNSDRNRALANFTWVNNVTVGAPHCRFAFADDGHHCLTLHQGLPFNAIAIEGEDPSIIGQLAHQLISPGQSAYTLAPDPICDVLTKAVLVEEVRREWQMLYQGDSGQLEPGDARLLSNKDFEAMQALAGMEDVMVFGPATFARGAFFGVFVGDQLVAMGGVQTDLPGISEIGSIVTHPGHRRRGYGRQVVAALVHHLQEKGHDIFLCLFQTNETALSLYESLDFKVINKLSLLRWSLSS